MVATRTMRAAELLALGDDARIELIEGEPIPMSPTGTLHMFVVSRIARLLTIHSLQVQETDAFEVLRHEGGFLLRTEPDTVLAPDIAILTRDQLRAVVLTSNDYCPVPPTLAIEVKSPSDREADIARKLAVYLAASVREVWWIRPLAGQMTVHRPDHAPETYWSDETFASSEVLPGFTLRIADLLNESTT
jgi:Uma2 family endonuclease